MTYIHKCVVSMFSGRIGGCGGLGGGGGGHGGGGSRREGCCVFL